MDIISSFERLIGWQILPIVMFFVSACLTDVREKKILNQTSGGLAIYNLIYFVLIPLIRMKWKIGLLNIMGGITAFGILLIPASYFLIKMGGDIKFAGAAGFALGPLGAISWVFVASTLVIVVGLYEVKFNDKNSWDTLPFAPFFFISFILHVLITYLIT